MVKIDISAEPAAPPEAGVKVHVRRKDLMMVCKRCGVVMNDNGPCVNESRLYRCPSCNWVTSDWKPGPNTTIMVDISTIPEDD